MAKVLDAAKAFGWKTAHFRTARTQHGWRTPVAGDGKGFPDMILFHVERQVVAYRELKAGKGRLSPEQKRWGEWLLACGQDWAVWRDTDWPAIVAFLSFGKATTTG